TTWTGAVSTSWHNVQNWNPQAIPDACNASVIIPAGTPHSPIISLADVSIANMYINSGAQLTLDGRDLNVCLHWTGGSGSNAAVVGSGMVIMNSGLVTQQFDGNTQF